MKKAIIAAAALFIAAQIGLLAQNWVLTNSGTNNWFCIACSADGNTVIAGQWGGAVAVSTNAGATWTTNALTNGYWGSVAASADGTKLLAAAAPSEVFRSTNSGANWVTNSLPSFYWGSVAMSADGNIMAAVAPIVSGSDFSHVSAVFCSTNSGMSWVSNNIDLVSNTVSSPSALGVTMSADGRTIYAIASLELCYSTNFGTSWMLMTDAPTIYDYSSPSQYIATSADGNTVIVCVLETEGEANGVYVSTNSGNTWGLTSLPQSNWGFVASSADGKTLMAAGYGFGEASLLYISTNSGASWTTNSNEVWAGVACSADGGALLAVAESDDNFDNSSGAIYRSQSVWPPLMSAALSGDGLLLSWIIPSTNFVLEQSGDLYNWSAVTNAPALNMANLEEQVLVPATNGVGFYRLVH